MAVPDAWGRVSRLTKTARTRRLHFVESPIGNPLCGSVNKRDWVTRTPANVNCPRCLKLRQGVSRG